MLNVIKRIQKASGAIDKKRIISENPKLRSILIAAYNPFKKYYITPPPLHGTEGGGELCTSNGWIKNEYYSLLEDLSSRDLSGNAAFEKVCDVLVSLSPEGAMLLRMVLNKDLRMGVGIKTINQVWPGCIPYSVDGDTSKPSIMLCKTFDPLKAVFPLMAAVKKDGIRGRAHDYRLQTRAGHYFIGFEHIEEELDKYPFEKDGEVCVPGLDFDASSGLVRNDQAVPQAIYWLFDCPSHPGNKKERYEYLKKHVVETDTIKIVEHRTCTNLGELMSFYEEALAAGDEGLVVYTIDHRYRDERSWDWTRLVPLKSADCTCIGFEEGTGKLECSLGKIIVQFGSQKVKVGTGFTEKPWKNLTIPEKNSIKKKYGDIDEEDYERIRRGFIWGNQSFFLGKIAKCVYKEKTKTGSMRQPRFKGWRLDKVEPNTD